MCLKSEEIDPLTKEAEAAEDTETYEDSFREEWSPDYIKTRVDECLPHLIKTGVKEAEETKEKEVASDSEADLLEDATPESTQRDMEAEDKIENLSIADIHMRKESERKKQFLSVERQERISKVVPDKKAALLKVAKHELSEDEHTERPDRA